MKADTPPQAHLALTGYALAALGAVLFAAKGILAKLAYAEGLDVETLLALRMALSSPFFIAVGVITYVRGRRRDPGTPSPLTRRTLLRTAAIGMLGYWFSSFADFQGLLFITPQFERMILFTYPLFVVLFGALFFRQPMRAATLLAFLVSYAGLALVFVQDFAAAGPDVVAGAAWVFAAALSYALYQLLAKEMIRNLGASLFTAVAMSGAALGVFVQFLATHPPEALLVSQRAFWIGVGIALGATVLPSFLMNAGLQRISAQANAIIGTASPVVTLGLAIVFLGERATWIDLAGCLLVIAGIGSFTVLDRRR